LRLVALFLVVFFFAAFLFTVFFFAGITNSFFAQVAFLVQRDCNLFNSCQE
jgi:hypothetical protein